eukprot:tig00000480_g1319.t1
MLSFCGLAVRQATGSRFETAGAPAAPRRRRPQTANETLQQFVASTWALSETPRAEGSATASPTPSPRPAQAADSDDIPEWIRKKMKGGQLRVRQHVNPLEARFQEPLVPPDWATVFEDAGRPIHLDVGVAKGRFLLEYAQRHPERNFVGVEIRSALVWQANRWRDELGLKNLHYLDGNINVSCEVLCRSFPPGTLDLVSIQMPDPWWKRRQQKRRVVQEPLTACLAGHLRPGGRIFAQSDVFEVAQQMRAILAGTPGLRLDGALHGEGAGEAEWLASNPLGLATEREACVLERGLPVYRAMFVKQG